MFPKSGSYLKKREKQKDERSTIAWRGSTDAKERKSGFLKEINENKININEISKRLNAIS